MSRLPEPKPREPGRRIIEDRGAASTSAQFESLPGLSFEYVDACFHRSIPHFEQAKTVSERLIIQSVTWHYLNRRR